MMHPAILLLGLSGAAMAACPYMDDSHSSQPSHAEILRRDTDAIPPTNANEATDFLKQFTVDDTDSTLTSDVGGPFSDQQSLSAGERGPTLLEDFIFRQKIQHFDHERVS
jgi:catalase